MKTRKTNFNIETATHSFKRGDKDKIIGNFLKEHGAQGIEISNLLQGLKNAGYVTRGLGPRGVKPKLSVSADIKDSDIKNVFEKWIKVSGEVGAPRTLQVLFSIPKYWVEMDLLSKANTQDRTAVTKLIALGKVEKNGKLVRKITDFTYSEMQAITIDEFNRIKSLDYPTLVETLVEATDEVSDPYIDANGKAILGTELKVLKAFIKLSKAGKLKVGINKFLSESKCGYASHMATLLVNLGYVIKDGAYVSWNKAKLDIPNIKLVRKLLTTHKASDIYKKVAKKSKETKVETKVETKAEAVVETVVETLESAGNDRYDLISDLLSDLGNPSAETKDVIRYHLLKTNNVHDFIDHEHKRVDKRMAFLED